MYRKIIQGLGTTPWHTRWLAQASKFKWATPTNFKIYNTAIWLKEWPSATSNATWRRGLWVAGCHVKEGHWALGTPWAAWSPKKGTRIVRAMGLGGLCGQEKIKTITEVFHEYDFEE